MSPHGCPERAQEPSPRVREPWRPTPWVNASKSCHPEMVGEWWRYLCASLPLLASPPAGAALLLPFREPRSHRSTQGVGRHGSLTPGWVPASFQGANAMRVDVLWAFLNFVRKRHHRPLSGQKHPTTSSAGSAASSAASSHAGRRGDATRTPPRWLPPWCGPPAHCTGDRGPP
jgi:hypothetical protein